MLDISELLDNPDFIQSVTFNIVTQSTDGGGSPSETTVQVTHATTNVQPASGTVLQRLPEGERSKDILQVFTKSSLVIKNGDYMQFNGKKYRCYTTEDWSQYGYSDSIFIRYNGSQEVTSDGFDPFA